MRTTIVIDDQIGFKLKALVSERKLSAFVNSRLKEYFDKKERSARLKKLEAAYSRASIKKEKVSQEFDALDTEGWPEW